MAPTNCSATSTRSRPMPTKEARRLQQHVACSTALRECSNLESLTLVLRQTMSLNHSGTASGPDTRRVKGLIHDSCHNSPCSKKHYRRWESSFGQWSS